CDPGTTFSTKPRSASTLSTAAKVIGLLMVNPPGGLVQDTVPEARELPDGRLVQHVVAGNPNGQGRGPALQGGCSAFREVGLDVEPIGHVGCGVVDDEDHRHRLAEPGMKVRPLDPERNPLSG